MRKLLLLPVLLLMSLLAVAQDETFPNIPADKIAAAAKPFLGIFDGVSCEGSDILGLRFEIAQTATALPIVKLTQGFAEGQLQDFDFTFETLAFTTKTDPDTNVSVDILVFTNGTQFVLVRAFKGMLVGIVRHGDNPQLTGLILLPSTGDLSAFMTTHSDLCTSAEARRKLFGDPEPLTMTPTK